MYSESDEICIHLKGQKCAESYCPYWSTIFRKCSMAVVAEKQAELLDIVVKRIEKGLKENPKAVPEEAMDLLRELRKTGIVFH